MKVVLLAVRNSLLIDQCDAMHWTGHSRDDYSSRSLWTRSSLAVEPVDQRVDVGAKLGAIPCGLRRTGVDGCGLGSRSFKTLRTVLDVGGSPWRSTDQEVACSSRAGRAERNPCSARSGRHGIYQWSGRRGRRFMGLRCWCSSSASQRPPSSSAGSSSAEGAVGRWRSCSTLPSTSSVQLLPATRFRFLSSAWRCNRS